MFSSTCSQQGTTSGASGNAVSGGSSSGGSTGGGSTPVGSSSGGSTGGGGTGDAGGPSTLACTLSGAGKGPSGNNASDFPTIAAIDFSAFPVDPGQCNGTHSFYVSTAGADANPGTSSQPFRTIAHALGIAASGDAILVSGGTYSENTLTIEKSNI